MIIGERLKGILKRHHITAKQFAEMIDVTEGMVYKYYKMENIDSQSIQKWSSVLYVPILAFLNDDEYLRHVHVPSDDDSQTAKEYYYEQKNLVTLNVNIVNRINEIIGHYKLSIDEFAKKVNIDTYSMRQQISGSRELNLLTISSIIVAFSSISPAWLLTGTGNMLMSNNDWKLNNDTTERLISLLESQQRTIENLSAR